jgi:transposase
VLTTKIHVIVDALGNPLRLILTGGQVHDITQADALLGLIEPGALLADKGYDADHFADSLIARAIEVVISPKSNRNVKRDLRRREISWPDYISSARSFGLNDDRP